MTGLSDDRTRAVDRAVVCAARHWLGTPYRHQGSRRGVGADCLGLLRGVWRDVIGAEPLVVPPYGRDWAEIDDREPLLLAMRTVLPESCAIAPGVVLVFRWSPGVAAKHCAIATAPNRMIHAYSGRGTIETSLPPSWRRRIAALHRFPDSTTQREG